MCRDHILSTPSCKHRQLKQTACESHPSATPPPLSGICTHSETGVWRQPGFINKNRLQLARQPIFKQTRMWFVKQRCQTFPSPSPPCFSVRSDSLIVRKLVSAQEGFLRGQTFVRLLTSPVQTERWHVETLKNRIQVTGPVRPPHPPTHSHFTLSALLRPFPTLTISCFQMFCPFHLSFSHSLKIDSKLGTGK